MKVIFCTFLFLVVCDALFAQTPESMLEKISIEYTPEKVYIQYDKPNYTAGETVWFKAYLEEGFLPAIKSTVLAVELIDDNGRLVDKKILPIVGSAAVGNFDLSKSLYEGNYIVRAFTRRQMNFGTEKFYTHPVTVYNPNNRKSIVSTTKQTTVFFFPEGGNIIADVENTVAFKCSNETGIPENIEGRILDSKGNEVVLFKSTHDGMGKFLLLPKSGETYTAECSSINGSKFLKPLPIIKNEGVVLQLKKNGPNLRFSVDAKSTNNEVQSPDYMLGVQENLVAFKVPLNYQGKKLQGTIPSQQLPTGILQVTIFNKFNQPLAERLVFINSGDFVSNGSLRIDTLNFDSRKKNVFSLSFLDSLSGTYAVSVTSDQFITSDEDNIVSHFLLSDDIKGTVYNPKYYFEKNDQIHLDNLDLVMLTHGWRRYTWNEILSNKLPSMTFKDPEFITIDAIVLDPFTNKPLLNKPLSIFFKTSGKLVDVLTVETNDKGEVKLPGLIFTDTAKIHFKNTDSKNGKVYVNIKSIPFKNNFLPGSALLPSYYFSVPDEKTYVEIKTKFEAGVFNNFSGITLDEIKVNARVKTDKENYEKRYTTGRLGSQPNKEIDFLSEPVKSAANILDFLKSRLNGVNISGGPLDYSIVYRNTRSLLGGPIQMSIFLDEMAVRPIDISTIRVSDVALVRVFSNSLSPDAGGTLAIYTKKESGVVENNFLANTIEMLAEGFSDAKEFFSPDYTQEKNTDILKDLRTTLYWNPYLNTNSTTNKINFSFFNNDNAKKYKIVIEGIQEDGKLLHIEKVIE